MGNLTDGVCPVILCGGSGTRLWPLSIDKHPKQFISLFGDQSLLQETASRMSGVMFNQPVIVCNHNHRFMVAQQLKDSPKQAIILEPFSKNTAPAIALAAFYLAEQNENALMLVVPSDHLIKDNERFLNAIALCEKIALNHIVTFGVTPTSPCETGYGYIKPEGKIGGSEAKKIASFIEKPSKELAEEYSKKGYLWNSGIFLFSAALYLRELREHSPLIYDICRSAFESGSKDEDYIRPDAEIFKNCPYDSIDYAVMENTDKAAIIEADMGWSDIGSWQKIWQSEHKDESGNVLKSAGKLIDSKNCYIRSSRQRISVAGLQNVAIIATDDDILVTEMGFSEKIGEFTDNYSI